MALTKYRKFMVERFLTNEKEITIDEYCKNSYKSTLKADEFKEWLSIYSEKYPKKVNKLKTNKTIIIETEKIVDIGYQAPNPCSKAFIKSEVAISFIQEYTDWVNFVHSFKDKGSYNSQSSYDSFKELLTVLSHEIAYEAILYYKKHPRIKKIKKVKKIQKSFSPLTITKNAFKVNPQTFEVNLIEPNNILD